MPAWPLRLALLVLPVWPEDLSNLWSPLFRFSSGSACLSVRSGAPLLPAFVWGGSPDPSLSCLSLAIFVCVCVCGSKDQ